MAHEAEDRNDAAGKMGNWEPPGITHCLLAIERIPDCSGASMLRHDLRRLDPDSGDPFDLDEVATKIREADGVGRMHSIVAVAEGAEPAHGHREIVAPAEIGHAEHLGGIG
jgi:hypothetical protein